MKNFLIIAAVIIAAWFIYSNYMPKEKPNNAVTQYADNLKTSVDKTEDAKKTANLATLRDAISQFKSSENRNPESLQELVQKFFGPEYFLEIKVPETKRAAKRPAAQKPLDLGALKQQAQEIFGGQWQAGSPEKEEVE